MNDIDLEISNDPFLTEVRGQKKYKFVTFYPLINANLEQDNDLKFIVFCGASLKLSLSFYLDCYCYYHYYHYIVFIGWVIPLTKF